ncbi:terminase large subunit domain-containing protein [Leclercia sp. W6]|uniref:terminase large subunit domain-containing protein n=1 Tax=Leclercia sp. W6 TaxID=2282310 RepID=UPI00143DDA01|nr:terminase family protein [Leclercia sp. W6]
MPSPPAATKFSSLLQKRSHVFKQYIVDFAKEVDVELKGDPMTLGNGACLYFLGTNARTAQSYHGNLYLDEYFWIPKSRSCVKLHPVCAAQEMAADYSLHRQPDPQRLPFWSGALYNKGRAKADRITWT